ncbi:MAG: nucleoside-diphosphate kinase [Candidatus Aenigmarchaeota archaeon]|nr:nucleoside-diphosphate kinase [Candidatus Aenigmarchaeota archaeon]
MKERTLVIIKPDGVERNLIGKIIDYYERGGLKITAMKMVRADKALVGRHYPEDDEYMTTLGKKSEKAGEKIKDYKAMGRKIVGWLRTYITRGPVVAMVLEGTNAIQRVREITGYTDPSAAEKGTIRGDLGNDSILKANKERRSAENLIHASGNREEAEREIKLWFPEMG